MSPPWSLLPAVRATRRSLALLAFGLAGIDRAAAASSPEPQATASGVAAPLPRAAALLQDRLGAGPLEAGSLAASAQAELGLSARASAEMLDRLLAGFAEDPLAAYAAAIEADCRAVRLVCVEGWLLPRTEALLVASYDPAPSA